MQCFNIINVEGCIVLGRVGIMLILPKGLISGYKLNVVSIAIYPWHTRIPWSVQIMKAVECWYRC